MKLPPRLVFPARAAACVLFVGHMAATCAPQVPTQSALAPLSRPFVHYLELTGIWQSWDMFTTIPYYHGYDVKLEVVEADGGKSSMGVRLPLFRKYDGSLRTETFFTRILDEPDFGAHLEGYGERVCAALRAQRGHGGQSLVLRESVERLRFLNEIRESGSISIHEDHTKTIPCQP